MTTNYEDYRVVHGMRIPYRRIESNEATGRTVYDVENVEINLDLNEDTFIIRAPDDPTGSGRASRATHGGS